MFVCVIAVSHDQTDAAAPVEQLNMSIDSHKHAEEKKITVCAFHRARSHTHTHILIVCVCRHLSVILLLHWFMLRSIVTEFSSLISYIACTCLYLQRKATIQIRKTSNHRNNQTHHFSVTLIEFTSWILSAHQQQAQFNPVKVSEFTFEMQWKHSRVPP